MNFIKTNGQLFNEKMGADVLEISIPAQTKLRYEPEKVWGRNGFIVNSDGAYDGEEGQINIHTSSANARKLVLKHLSSADKIIKVYVNSIKYFRLLKVTGHQMEIISPTDCLHAITVSCQPFYYAEARTLASDGMGRTIVNDGDVPAPVVVRLQGSGQTDIIIGSKKTVVNVPVGGLTIDTMDMDIYNDTGQKGRSLVQGFFPYAPVGSSMVSIAGNGSSWSLDYYKAYTLPYDLYDGLDE